MTKIFSYIIAAVVVLSTPLSLSSLASAATIPTADEPAPSDFSIQVSPSPLVATVKPGQTSDLEVQIRNNGSQTESLKIEPRSFTVDNNSEEVKLNDTTPPDITTWLTFQPASFTIESGDTLTERVKIKVPQEAGFSYSFALVISRQKDQKAVDSGRLIKGSLAIFTLINIDKPGATRKLDVTKFTVKKRVYEYLPAEMTIQFRNTGNSIVQPYGNIYIQRKIDDTKPLDTLSVNDKRGYILPGSTRTLTAKWDRGFPVYQTTTASNGDQTTKLTWDFSEADHLRIGKYTAKIVAVYNDGNRDVPIEGSVEFWVIPWKIIGGASLIGLIVLFGIGAFIWRVSGLANRKKKSKKPVVPVEDQN